MRIFGEFTDIDGRVCSVEITNNRISDGNLTIGKDGIWLGGDPVTIESTIDSTFDPIIKQRATISLVTSSYIGRYFFAEATKDISVVVKRDNKVLFSGYLTMNLYSQPFNTMGDMFQLECIDKLSTLEYYNYKDVNPSTYPSLRSSATTVTFKTILLDALDSLGGDIWYDNTKGISNARLSSVFDDIGVSEHIFIGEGFDDVATREDTLKQILQYLNLHIFQQGNDFYIFDWETIKNRRTNTWVNLRTGAIVGHSTRTIEMTGNLHKSNDTKISIEEIFTQIQVNCNLESQEDLITNPFDSGSLYSRFSNKQLYMTEYISEGEGESSLSAFQDMLKNNPSDYDGGKMIDWYVQVMDNDYWELNPTAPLTYETSTGQYINQHNVLKQLVGDNNRIKCALIQAGSHERKANAIQDVDPVSQINMSNYLYISCNGNREHSESTARPNNSDIDNRNPIMIYRGNQTSGVYSPVDEDTINYIVFTGKITLQPLRDESKVRGAIVTTVPSKNNDDGMRYARKWYEYRSPKDSTPTRACFTEGTAAATIVPGMPTTTPGLMMPNSDMAIDATTIDKHEDPFTYGYSAYGDSSDRIRKIPILECELIIGDKRLVETNVQPDGSSTFMWCKIGEEPSFIINGQVVKERSTTFTIGINPAIDDVLLGTEFDIANTISHTQNIDATGTAIAITKSDALSGNIQFKILGPCAVMWNQIVRIHPTFWRHTDWKTDYMSLLASCGNILIKDFECKIYTDSGLNTEYNDNDLMYVSNETTAYINKKDDIDFDIVTQISSMLAKEKGIKAGIYKNAAINMTTSQPLEYLYNYLTNTGTNRPEEHYVDEYWRAFSKPKLLMETKLEDSPNADFRDIYNSKVLGKELFIKSIGRNVKQNTINLVLKEI